MFHYTARVVRVIDGDTIVVDVDLGFNIRHVLTVRLQAIDAPELGTERGAQAKAFVEAWVVANPIVELTTVADKHGVDRTDSFGRRYLAVVFAPDDMSSLNVALMDAGLAIKYVKGSA